MKDKGGQQLGHGKMTEARSSLPAGTYYHTNRMLEAQDDSN